MASFAGLRGTGSWGTDERPKNFREMILWSDPNGSAPLTAFMSKMASESVNDPEFNWWCEQLKATRIKHQAAVAATTDNTLTVIAAGSTSSGGLSVVAGDVLMIEKTETTTPSNELVVVSSVTNDTTIVIKRGAANTTAAPIASGAFLLKLGNAFEEGANGPDLSARNPTKYSNLCQIFKTGYGITNTAKETKARTGDPYKNDKKRRSFDHAAGMELAFMFGQKYEDTSGSFPKRFMGGLRSFITTNVTLFATSPTEDTFLNAVYPVFDYNSKSGAGNQRICFAGNGFLNNLNKLARTSSSTRINFDGTIKTYGMELQKWVLPQGTIGVRTHPLMNTNTFYTNSAFIIDPTNLKYRYLRDTAAKDNVQANDSDTQEGFWLTECSLEVHHEYTMAYLGNFVI